MKRIYLPSEFVHILAKEFSATTVTVYTSLRYYNNSELAMKIRTRAKELLLAEADKVIINPLEN